MTDAFLEVLRLSISASWLVLAVVALRFLFGKAPKAMRLLLWGLVAFRLLCPITIESQYSLVPEIPEIPEIKAAVVGDQYSEKPDTFHTDQGAASDSAPEIAAPTLAPERDPAQQIVTDPASSDRDTAAGVSLETVLAAVWVMGMGALAVYSAGSYWRLYSRIRTAVRLRENIYSSEFVATPFVLGFLKPRIFLPNTVSPQDAPHVIAHEQAHISRRDHWWKPLGYALLTVHWFNPLMWAAYILLCRDIELACDEKVVEKLGTCQRADYSQALLTCSVHANMILVCPVAFGEIGVKERVKNVLNYRKPGMWITLLMAAALVVSAVCFVTVQPAQADENPQEPVAGSEDTGEVQYNTGSSITVVNGEGLEYKLSATAVTPAGMRLYFLAEEATCFQIDNYFWIEQQTEDGWQALEARLEDPELMSQTVGYSAIFPTGFDWPVDWSGIYGVLEPGTYRFCTTLYEDDGPVCLEFVIGATGDSLKAQALARCNAALDALLAQESYHLEYTYARTEDPLVDVDADLTDNNDLNRHEYLRSGNDYLLLKQTYQTGVLNGGIMLRDGEKYWMLNEEYGNGRTPAVCWTPNPDRDLEVFFRWVGAFTWTINDIRAAEMTDSTVTLTLKGGASQVTVFHFQEDGSLEQIVCTREDNATNNYPAYTSVTTLRVLDTTAAQIAAEIAGQDLETCYSFSWEEEQGKLDSAVDRDYANTEPSAMDGLAQVIARAERECTVDYTDIIAYHDDAAGVWKVEFRNGYGKWITETIYLDENGVTKLITFRYDLE